MFDFHETDKFYQLDSRPTAVPEEVARERARLLQASDYIKIGGCAISAHSELTITQMLNQCDLSRRYSSNFSERDDIAIGPIIADVGDSELYMPGITIWKRTPQD